MDDLISRQAAIKLAIDLDYENRGILKESRCRDIEIRYNMIPSAQPEQKKGRWIPVTERLPDPYSGEYLVTINDGSVYEDILMFDAPGDGIYESCFYKTDADGYAIICRDVVAWMPLPEPYSKGV